MGQRGYQKISKWGFLPLKLAYNYGFFYIHVDPFEEKQFLDPISAFLSF
jgi:hypothetical protein